MIKNPKKLQQNVSYLQPSTKTVDPDLVTARNRIILSALSLYEAYYREKGSCVTSHLQIRHFF